MKLAWVLTFLTLIGSIVNFAIYFGMTGDPGKFISIFAGVSGVFCAICFIFCFVMNYCTAIRRRRIRQRYNGT